MQSKATTVEQYLAGLPADRRAALQAVRDVFLKSLDKDYREGIQYGMIGYYVPHSVFPDGYHCDPSIALPFAGLASQKNHMSLSLMCVYFDADAKAKFCAAWAKAGKKLDMGAACIRFKKLEDVALDVLANTIASMPARKYVELYKTLRDANSKRPVKGPPKKKAPTKKPAKGKKKTGGR